MKSGTQRDENNTRGKILSGTDRHEIQHMVLDTGGASQVKKPVSGTLVSALALLS